MLVNDKGKFWQFIATRGFWLEGVRVTECPWFRVFYRPTNEFVANCWPRIEMPPFILILMKSSDCFWHYVNAFAEASFFGNGKFLRSQVREEYLDCRSNVLSLFRRNVGSRRAHWGSGHRTRLVAFRKHRVHYQTCWGILELQLIYFGISSKTSSPINCCS